MLDGSAAVEWLLHTRAGLRVEERVFRRTETIHAPHLMDIEVVHALRRLVAARVIPAVRAQEAIDDLLDLFLRRHPHDAFLPRVWEMRDNITAYDAVYVALAELLDAPLITCDARLAAAPGHFARVEFV